MGRAWSGGRLGSGVFWGTRFAARVVGVPPSLERSLRSLASADILRVRSHGSPAGAASEAAVVVPMARQPELRAKRAISEGW